MTERNQFFNERYGWNSRPCDEDLAIEANAATLMPRYFREGEAEGKCPALTNVR